MDVDEGDTPLPELEALEFLAQADFFVENTWPMVLQWHLLTSEALARDPDGIHFALAGRKCSWYEFSSTC